MNATPPKSDNNLSLDFDAPAVATTAAEPSDVQLTNPTPSEVPSGGAPPADSPPPLALPDDPDGALSLADYAERAYLEYAVSVVKGRALPDVCDGQKPVQRRILFSMNEMGLSDTAKPVKSARVVGDVLGKFHPHGDTAAYDALVRMAQDFSLRYPLIDGQGNFGSRDGDGAAAMRYTEARLTKYARLLLDEIDSGTVDFVDNYDGSHKEPALLPARLPMVLLNGASGIAVGMATEIPSHNLREVAAACVAMLKNDKTSLEEILEFIPGPDFPGGGQISSPAGDIRDIYSSGRGSIKMRARYTIEEMARGQWQLVVTELPAGVSSQKVLEEIEELTNPKIRMGKKALSPEQLQLKQTVLGVLDAVRDESGKKAAVRLVFEPKTSRIEQKELLSILLSYTSLETSVSMNLVMIGLDGRPVQKNLLSIIKEWCEFRFATVTKRCEHRLGKINDRIHILEGRRLVLLNIDEVIRIIRESDEPKPALITAFNLSDRQAEDILEIRLRQLARLEAIKIEQELEALNGEKKGLQNLLDSPAAMKRQIIKEVEADAKTFGDDRRTVMEAVAKATVEVKVSQEPVTVIASTRGWVRARQGHGHDTTQFQFKGGDSFAGAFEVMSSDTLYALANNGKVLSVPVSSLPSARGDGSPITSFFELEAGMRIDHIFAAGLEDGVMMVVQSGLGLICQAKDLQTRMKAGKQFLTLDDGDVPLKPSVFTQGMDRVLCLSADGKALVFALAEVKVLKNGGRGVIMLGLDKGEKLSAAIVYQSGVVVTGAGRGGKHIDREMSRRELSAFEGSRSRKGKLLEPRVKEASLRLLPIEKASK
jgi:topoisomerase IV subunit A